MSVTLIPDSQYALRELASDKYTYRYYRQYKQQIFCRYCSKYRCRGYKLQQLRRWWHCRWFTCMYNYIWAYGRCVARLQLVRNGSIWLWLTAECDQAENDYDYDLSCLQALYMTKLHEGQVQLPGYMGTESLQLLPPDTQKR